MNLNDMNEIEPRASTRIAHAVLPNTITEQGLSLREALALVEPDVRADLVTIINLFLAGHTGDKFRYAKCQFPECGSTTSVNVGVIVHKPECPVTIAQRIKQAMEGGG